MFGQYLGRALRHGDRAPRLEQAREPGARVPWIQINPKMQCTKLIGGGKEEGRRGSKNLRLGNYRRSSAAAEIGQARGPGDAMFNNIHVLHMRYMYKL